MKKSFLMMAVVTVLTGAGLTLLSHSSESSLTPTQIANLEALAGPPTGSSGGSGVPCFSSAFRDSEGAYVDCSECLRYEGWTGYGTESTCGGRQ